MYNYKEFKKLVEMEESLTIRVEGLNHEIRRYLEGKHGRRLEEEEVEILAMRDWICDGAMRELWIIYGERVGVGGLIEVGAGAMVWERGN